MTAADILALKANEDPARSLRITITDDRGAGIGSLTCIDRAMAARDDIVADLTLWRAEHTESFLTQFTPTIARTKAWLTDVVIPARERLLFLIEDGDGRFIGNCGLCGIEPPSAELDNILRARRSARPRMAFHALAALIGWSRSALGIGDLHLHVFSHNDRAIRLYRDLGFAEQTEYPLTVEATQDGRRYRVGSEAGEPVDFTYLRMALPAVAGGSPT